MQKNRDNIKLFSTDSSLKTDVYLDEIKTTNVNILLNRVRAQEKNDSKKKILFSFLMITVISVISIITISN